MNLFIQQVSIAYPFLSISLSIMCQVPGPERADGRRGYAINILAWIDSVDCFASNSGLKSSSWGGGGFPGWGRQHGCMGCLGEHQETGKI